MLIVKHQIVIKRYSFMAVTKQINVDKYATVSLLVVIS